MSKPYHLMTPAERTAARIAANRAIAEKIDSEKTKKPPTAVTTSDFTRETPEERAARRAGVIRKIDS